MIPVYVPFLNEKIKFFAHEAIESGWISSTGKYLTLAEEKLKEILQVKYVVLTNTGTAAMHLITRSLSELFPLNTNVIVPNNVYIAAWNSFRYEYGHFRLFNTDTDINTWNMDYDSLSDLFFKTNSSIILCVHNLGNIINVPRLKSLYPTAIFIEDACESLGGKYEDKFAGTDSLASALSFYGNKNYTSGEGGAVITNNEDFYNLSIRLRGQGQSDTKFVHDMIGYNYRMTNIEAALLYGSLLYFEEIKERKQELFNRYREELDGIDVIKFQESEENTNPSNWMFGIRLKNSGSYDEFNSFMLDRRIETRPFFYPIQAHKPYRERWGNTSTANLLSKEVAVLPSHTELTSNNIKYICDQVKRYVE